MSITINLPSNRKAPKKTSEFDVLNGDAFVVDDPVHDDDVSDPAGSLVDVFDGDDTEYDPVSALLIVLAKLGVPSDTLDTVIASIDGNTASDPQLVKVLVHFAHGRDWNKPIGFQKLSYASKALAGLLAHEVKKKTKKLPTRPVVGEIMSLVGSNEIEVNLKTGDLKATNENADFSLAFDRGGNVNPEKSNVSGIPGLELPPSDVGTKESHRLYLSFLKMSHRENGSLPNANRFVTKLFAVTGRGRNRTIGYLRSSFPELSNKIKSKVTANTLTLYQKFVESKDYSKLSEMCVLPDNALASLCSLGKAVGEDVTDSRAGSNVLKYLRSVRGDEDGSKVSAYAIQNDSTFSHIAGLLKKQNDTFAYVGCVPGVDGFSAKNDSCLIDRNRRVIFVGSGEAGFLNVKSLYYFGGGPIASIDVVDPRADKSCLEVPGRDFLDCEADELIRHNVSYPGIRDAFVVSDAQSQSQIAHLIDSTIPGPQIGNKSKGKGAGKEFDEFDFTAVFAYQAMKNQCAFYGGKMKLIFAEDDLKQKIIDLEEKYVFAMRGADRASNGEVMFYAYRRDVFPKLDKQFPYDKEGSVSRFSVLVRFFQVHAVAVSAARLVIEAARGYMSNSILEGVGATVMPDAIYFIKKMGGKWKPVAINRPGPTSLILQNRAAGVTPLAKEKEETAIDFSTYFVEEEEDANEPEDPQDEPEASHP